MDFPAEIIFKVLLCLSNSQGSKTHNSWPIRRLNFLAGKLPPVNVTKEYMRLNVPFGIWTRAQTGIRSFC